MKPAESGSHALEALMAGMRDDPTADGSLDSLARLSGCSPFQFHRRFSREVGETPRAFVQRVRLEQAAYRVAVGRETLLDIALATGFSGPETFARAFRRRFGISPSHYRCVARAAQRERLERGRLSQGAGCDLDDVIFTTLGPMTLLAMRRIGSYATIDRDPGGEGLWSALARRAAASGIRIEDKPVLLCLDDPTVTPPHLQQADLCLPLVGGVASADGLRRINLPHRRYAAIRHRGPAATLIQAYRALADAIRRSGFDFAEGPPMELLGDWSMPAKNARDTTWIYFPVVRRGRIAQGEQP